MASATSYMRIDQQTVEMIKSQIHPYVLKGKARLEKLKPMSEFFDKNRFSPPSDVKMFTSRLQVNLVHFSSNYMAFGLVAILYSLLTNLWLLIDVIVVLVGVRFITSMSPNEPTALFNGKLVLTQSQAWVALACLATLILWFTAAGSAIFWVACVTVTLIILHAGFMDKPIESDFASDEV
ncbi:hypothetical protein HDU67_000742 [Dinochytrium kinnereticum]|nr:hypothetical protein HDU67_000742 [Dinochytrium kinnereticum]